MKSIRNVVLTAMLGLSSVAAAHGDAHAHGEKGHGHAHAAKKSATRPHSHGQGHSHAHGHSHGGPSAADKKIELHRQRVKKFPRAYAIWTELGGAYLDKARETHDARWLKNAQVALEKSISMQPSYEAHAIYAMVKNYGHRFAEGLEQVEKARPASPVAGVDPLLLTIQVEALIGLGRLEEAQVVVDAPGNPEHFLIVSSRAQVQRALKRHDEAVATLAKARELAQQGKDRELAAWTAITSATVLVNAGKLDEARKQMDEAARIDHHSHDLPLLQAKLHTAAGEHALALRVYEGLLQSHLEPSLAHQAFLAAQKLGWTVAAENYFAMAEKGYQQQLDIGEIHTLGALAQLYLDAGVKRQEARQLAEENWKYKRDEDARITLEQARQELATR